jgi:hypothetical protein
MRVSPAVHGIAAKNRRGHPHTGRARQQVGDADKKQDADDGLKEQIDRSSGECRLKTRATPHLTPPYSFAIAAFGNGKSG